MNFHYYFRHMSTSEALKYDFERKMASGMESLIQTSNPVHVTFSVEGAVHKVHVGLHARNNTLIEVEETSEDMHKSLDRVMDNLHRQLSREKDRMLRHKTDRFAAAEVSQSLSPADNFVDEEFAAAP